MNYGKCEKCRVSEAVRFADGIPMCLSCFDSYIEEMGGAQTNYPGEPGVAYVMRTHSRS